ncbi:hypothetical protein RHS01_07879 [Rhizoctonia solani]|uniref:Uncharacterized protein n=1 Tax=Rhizoctonia solani TaxID=456999 RepID=A0A8H7M4N0_9AGAM|nr:hypothetical protein RHS01_07879 [Rhizoctonia solani]
MFHCNVETIPGRDRGRPLVFPIKVSIPDNLQSALVDRRRQWPVHLVKLFRLPHAESPVDKPHVLLVWLCFHLGRDWDVDQRLWYTVCDTAPQALYRHSFIPLRPPRVSPYPITLNVLCFMPPSGLALTQVITSTYSAIAWSDLVHTQFGLIDLLKMLAGQWAQSATHDLDRALAARADDMGTLFLIQKDKSQVAFQKNAWTCKPNSLLPAAHSLICSLRRGMVLTLHRLVHAYCRLATLGHQGHDQPTYPPGHTTRPASDEFQRSPDSTASSDCVRRRSAESSFAPFSQGRQAATNTPYKQPNTPGAVGANWTTNSQAGQNNDDSIKPLKRALFCNLRLLSSVWGVASGSWLWIAADAGRLIVNPTLHALAILLTIWVYVIVGCLVNLFILIRTRRPDDSSTSENNMPLSAIKASHASSSQSHTRSELERKPVYIVAHTTTHVVVDDPGHRSSGSDHAVDVTSGGRQPYDGQGDMESAYSLSSAHFADDPAKIKALDDVEWSKR